LSARRRHKRQISLGSGTSIGLLSTPAAEAALALERTHLSGIAETADGRFTYRDDAADDGDGSGDKSVGGGERLHASTMGGVDDDDDDAVAMHVGEHLFKT
jgi:hypothetical protein